MEVFPALFVQSVGDGFGAVDWRTTTNTDDGVNAGVIEYLLGRFVEIGYRCVLLDVAESAGVFIAQELLDLFDQLSLGRQRASCDDKGLGFLGRETA